MFAVVSVHTTWHQLARYAAHSGHQVFMCSPIPQSATTPLNLEALGHGAEHIDNAQVPPLQ